MSDDTLIFGGVSPGSFAGSMAEEIEKAFNRLLAAEHKETLPTDDSPETRDRRRLFVAIAEGVIRHLDAKEDALKVVFTQVPFEGTISARIDVKRQQ